MKKKALLALCSAALLSMALPVASSADEWRQDSNGWWYEIDDDDDDHDEDDFDYDDYAKNGWRFIDGKWYYFDPYGYMKTGWIRLDDDDWYYLNADGSLLTNAYTPDGYWVDDDGEWDHRDRDDRFDDDWDDIYDDLYDDDRYDDDRDDRYDDDWDDRYDDDDDDDWDDRYDDQSLIDGGSKAENS